MKKIIFFAIIVLAAVALALPQIAAADGGPEAWAEGIYTLGSGGGEAASPAEYELSSNVFLYYTADNTFTSYALGSLHQSGNRSYATSNNTTLIYWSDKSTGDTADSDSVVSPGATSFTGDSL
jgi:hypothetical protein